MPLLPPVTGIFGKVPAHGDFVRRGLPTSFIAPWDAWLQAGIAHARESLGANWPAAWDQAPAWRFLLPAGACGPDAVAGVMLPSEDMVGRRFPITLAALLPAGTAAPEAEWFDAVEEAARAGRQGQADADALAGAVPVPGAPLPSRRLAEAAPVAPPPEPPAAPGTDAEAPPPRPAEDVLGLFAADGAGMLRAADPDPVPAPTRPGGVPGDDILALLAAARPPPEDTPSQARPSGDARSPLCPPDDPPRDDVLSLFSAELRATPPPPAPTPPEDRDDDRTLSFLIGEADTSAIDAAEPAGPDAAPLPADRPADPAPTPPSCDPAPAAHTAIIGASAPPGPEGGGWWTRGAARFPPMVWALPGLPSPAEFAYLLEAEA